MTGGDAVAPRAGVHALRAARQRAGWSQASAMRRFQEAATKLGATPPEGPSLKRMFAYWERGERTVTVEAYRDAFCTIYAAPPEALGFVQATEPTAGGEAGELDATLALVTVDRPMVQMLEAETHNLRLLDRRLGSTAAAAVEAHAGLLEDVLHRCVGAERAAVAGALAEGAALAGWLALDRCDIAGAWRWHQLARSAAVESGSPIQLGHVLAQASIVLLDAGQPASARELASEARQLARGRVPPRVTAWLLASEAEVHARAGDQGRALRLMDAAESALRAPDEDDAPFLMLDLVHLARWRGHCLALGGAAEARDYLTLAAAGEGDSLRAAAGRHADLAHALETAGERDAARTEAEVALDLARRCGSIRQARRMRLLLDRAAAGSSRWPPSD